MAPIRAAVVGACDGHHPITPLPPTVASGPARFARFVITEMDDQIAVCHVDGQPEVAKAGAFGALTHLGLISTLDRIHYDWAASRHRALHWHTITSVAPQQGDLANDTTAFCTRDAIGWAIAPGSRALVRSHAELAPFGALPEGVYWPMLWIRDAPSAHQKMERAERLRADLAFMVAQTASRLDPTPTIL